MYPTTTCTPSRRSGPRWQERKGFSIPVKDIYVFKRRVLFRSLPVLAPHQDVQGNCPGRNSSALAVKSGNNKIIYRPNDILTVLADATLYMPCHEQRAGAATDPYKAYIPPLHPSALSFLPSFSSVLLCSQWSFLRC